MQKKMEHMKNKAWIAILLISNCLVSEDIKQPLTLYAWDYTSQFGEDGIIRRIFEIIGDRSKVCVEFGAADGLSCSNTARLWKELGWRALLIEKDPDQFEQLLCNTRGYENVQSLYCAVGIAGDRSLDHIFSKFNMPNDIDLLSIDIDGDDYHVFASLKHYHPRVIICEFNPTLPPEVEIYAQYGARGGCSQKALVNLAQSKGYELVAITIPNCIFVTREEFHKFSDYETALEKIASRTRLKYLVQDYDGNYQIVGLWHTWTWFSFTGNKLKPYKFMPMHVMQADVVA